MFKKIIISMLVSLVFFTANSQHSIRFTHPDNLFHEGKELFDQRKFAASYRCFEDFLKTAVPTNAGMIQEAEFYLAGNAYELRQQNAEELLLKYVEEHPYTPFWDKSYAMLGNLRYEDKDYQKALNYFRLVDETHLVEHEKVDYLFSRGYANLATGNNSKALDIFNTLKKMNSPHQAAARYYTGYTEYMLKNYDAALTDLLVVEKHPEFEDIAPYYVAQIYYAGKNYPEMEKRADMLLKKYPENKNNAELYRMIGEKAYTEGNYLKAIENLKRYESLFSQVLRNDVYYLGVSYLKTNQPADAVKYLSKVTTQQDEMSESAYLQLGNAYVALGDKNNARMAYEVATRTNFNPKVREEALYNYALTTYETNAAFGESVNAFEQFIREYPNSNNIDKAYDYLSTVYLTSKNYEAAYQSILKIKNLTPKLLETKQYLEYQVGTEAFTAGNYSRAAEFFTKALQSAPNGRYLADAYYWRSESNYRLNYFSRSAADLTAFFNLPGVTVNPNYVQAFYSLGYAYFRQQKYSDSLSWFLKFLDNEKNTQSPMYFDALNRVGDAYFSARNFSRATEYYERAMSDPSKGDYALFQSAYMSGLQKNYQQKIIKLEQLLKLYPNSEYGDDALYEIGRSFVMLENNMKVIENNRRLLATYPNSVIAPKAQLEIGMVYFNENDYDNAIPVFKKVIADYPMSEEAETALESLETVHINTNNVNSYMDYVKSLGRPVDRNAEVRADSITFIAAEKQYIAGNYSGAISSFSEYLQRYCPSGKFCALAQNYLADSYYSSNNRQKALEEYAKITTQKGNPYAEEAALRAAEIAFDGKDYSAAMSYFKKLDEVAQSTENKNIARLGVLRSSYMLNDEAQTIQIAGEIAADPKSTADMKSEALLNRAKVYVKQNKPSDAMKDLSGINIDTRTSIGAEAKYMLSEVYFRLNQLNNAEKEVLDFAKTGTPHQYWLARSFVVLSDVYIQKGDDFQAKQYLLSLQKNYTAKNDIQEMINSRLNVIDARSNQNVIN